MGIGSIQDHQYELRREDDRSLMHLKGDHSAKMKEKGKVSASTAEDAVVEQTGTSNGSAKRQGDSSSIDLDKPCKNNDVVEQAADASVTSAGDNIDDGASSNASSSKAHRHHHHIGGGGGGGAGRHHVHIAHHHAAPHHHHYARAHPNMRGGAGRHRSAIGLMRPPSTGAMTNATTTNGRGTSTIRGHGRVASSSKLSHASSTSTLPTEESTHSVSEEHNEEIEDENENEAEHGRKVAARVPDAPAMQSTSPLQPKANKEEGRRRAPVTFTMGSMDDDSDEEEDDDVAGKTASTSAQAASAKKSDAKAVKEADDGDSSGDWSSDTSEDPEEDKRREEEKRRKQEQERVDSMFKKIPIRSQSAADVRLLDSGSAVPNDATVAQLAPARGLLSSMFHPEEERHRHASHAKHSSEGLAARRPHASAVDVAHMLRQRSPKDRELRKASEGAHRDEQSSLSGVLPRAPSFGNLGALGTLGGGLKMSKSAVALPVLSTLGSRTSTAAPSTANAVENHKRPSSTHRAVFSGDESDNEDEEDATLVAGGASSLAGASGGSSSYAGGSAMDRLNELAHIRSKNKSGRPLSLRSNASEQEVAVGDRRRMSGGSSTSAGAGNGGGGGGGGGKRTSLSSLDVQVRPDLEEEAIRQQRRTSMPFETPTVSAPIKLPARSKSAANIPDVGLPQSPRTTRRNMLRDELSESLRQNLLWERQSRNRMLGMGMTSSNAAPATAGTVVTSSSSSSAGTHHARSSSAGRVTSPPAAQQHPGSAAASAHHRPQSVLGGNALRPLTTRNSSSSGSTNRDSGRYTGDFHHTGW